MKKSTACLFLLGTLFYSVTKVSACINEIGRSTVGEGIYVDGSSAEDFMKKLTTHADKDYWKHTLSELTPVKKRGSLPERNNAAVAMLHLGMIREAIEILRAIERENPGLYYTATNLGTAYELNGENAKALEWIKEGTRRHPGAHNGSEWLHVKILEAKVAIGKDRNWLARNSVLGINREPNEILMTSPSVLDHLGQSKTAADIEDALVYQLHERLEFIKPPEGVVANLLFDLSRIVSMSQSTDHGAVIRAFAQTYGPDLMPWTIHEPPVPAVAVPPPPPPPASMVFSPIVWGLATLVAIGVAVAFIRWRKKRMS